MKTYTMPYTPGIIGSLSGKVTLNIKGDEPGDGELNKLYAMAEEQCAEVPCSELNIDIYLGE